MSQQDIIRAWKDPEFRNNLSEAQRSQLPENPAEIIEMSDAALETVVGGCVDNTMKTTYMGGCNTKTK